MTGITAYPLSRGWKVLLSAVLFYAFVCVLTSAVLSPLNHDEHMFLGSAFAMAVDGFVPYRDFPYFHMPNLLFIHGGLFLLSDYPFLAARLFSALSTIAIFAIVFLISYSVLGRSKAEVRIAVSAACVILLANSPLVGVATSYVWNHTLSTMCALAAYAMHRRALLRGGGTAVLVASGFFLGFALGVRLSFAPLLAPFVIMLLMPGQGTPKHRLASIVKFTAGVGLANLPAIVMVLADPAAFFFGNLGYAGLNTVFRYEMGFDGPMSFAAKVRYLTGWVFSRPGDLLILVAVAFSLLGVKVRGLTPGLKINRDLVFLLLLMPFLYLGSFAPTPSWYQYFFSPMPFLVLLIPFGIANIHARSATSPRLQLLAITIGMSTIFGPFPKNRQSVVDLLNPSHWPPVRFHQVSREMASHLPAASKRSVVLTLAPLYAVESGFSIYPELATGPFGWRIGHLMTRQERRSFSIVGPTELEDLVAFSAPSAILTNTPRDASLEEPLRDLAVRLGYRARSLSDGTELWLPPR